VGASPRENASGATGEVGSGNEGVVEMMWIWLLILIMSVVVITVGYYSDIDHEGERYVETHDFGDDFWDDWT
jgi:hypothetical protein